MMVFSKEEASTCAYIGSILEEGVILPKKSIFITTLMPNAPKFWDQKEQNFSGEVPPLAPIICTCMS
jgi:hypothetical protein